MVEPFVVTDQEIHATVKVSPSSPAWSFSVIYACTCLNNRLRLWHNLKALHDINLIPWLICGDFNEVLNASETFGGNPVNTRITTFLDCLPHLGMHDLCFTSSRFTWTNNRQFTHMLIMECLDRSLANSD